MNEMYINLTHESHLKSIVTIIFLPWKAPSRLNICLLFKGGNFSSPNQDGRTALHVACREGQLEVVQYLLHHGANVHAKDLDKKTPLMDAIQNKHFSIISLLVQTGAVINIQPVNLAMELCRYLLQQFPMETCCYRQYLYIVCKYKIYLCECWKQTEKVVSHSHFFPVSKQVQINISQQCTQIVFLLQQHVCKRNC